MGGLGYSWYSGVGMLYGDDVNQTLEGDNEVLIQ